ncbi:MAG: (2Fe-2S)-binding protein [Halobacteriales archaeon]
MRVSFDLDGEATTVDVAPDRSLRSVLRGECDAKSVKNGCESGRCGSCTVLIDGNAVKSCLLPAGKVGGRAVTTVEGIDPGTPGRDLQDAFEAEFALQCGYCTPGFLLSAAAYLDDDPDPDREAIRSAIEGNVCRCTGYGPIVDAVEAVAADGAATDRDHHSTTDEPPDREENP